MFRFQRATQEDSSYAKVLREADKLEIKAGGHKDIKKCLEESIVLCKYTYKVVDSNGNFYAFFGCSEEGIVWAMSTKEFIDNHTKDFFKVSYRFMKFSHRVSKAIGNYIWSGNKVHIKWLEGMGFNVVYNNYQINNITGEKFYPFYKEV